MASAATTRPAERHPWLDRFLANPASELEGLLSGHARIDPYENADAPDAAMLLFGGLPTEDEALAVLDRTLNVWLDSQRVGGVPTLEPLPLERWIRRVSEAFEIIGLLRLKRCSMDLRQRFDIWNSWAERLAISNQRDGRHAFWRTVALTQRLVAEVEPKVSLFLLEPFWLRMCEQAGSNFAAHYLAVGLLGLRMLPERRDTPSERAWMAGLAHWAIGQSPTIEEFSRQWWALKGLYPRMPAHWRTAVSDTLAESFAEHIRDDIKDWWLQDVEAAKNLAAGRPKTRSVSAPKLSPLSRVESLLNKTQDPLPSFKQELEDVIDERRRYAESTGESYYLVTTACKIGMAIIEGADDPMGRGRLAADLAQQALAWQPANVYAWALWRGALARQGAFGAAELVGWEAIRRFPEDVQWRTQLALLLAGISGRESDAEYLLRETIDRFPDNLVARNQLAELLIALDRTDEAVLIVDDMFSRHREDEASFDLRARLLYHFGDVETARAVLNAGVRRSATNRVLQTHLQMLDRGQPLPLKAAAFRVGTAVTHGPAIGAAGGDRLVGAGVRRRGRLRWLFSGYERMYGDDEWRKKALEEVQQILLEDPNLAYARYLERELTGRDGTGSIAGSFALEFIEAMKRKDADRFAQLEKSHPGQARLVDAAKVALFSDRSAADRTLVWLRQGGRSEPRSVSALRGFLRQRFDVSSSLTDVAFIKLVADNDNNIRADLIESVLATEEILLAA